MPSIVGMVRARWHWLCAMAGVGLASLALAGATVDGPWALQVQQVWIRPWALWSTVCVHHDAPHRLVNLIALAALAVIGWRWGVDAATTHRWVLIGWPLTSALTLAADDLAYVYGLSGFVHGVAALLAAWGLRHTQGHDRTVALMLGLLLALKVLGEQAWNTPVADSVAWGFPVVVANHLAGALSGLLIGLWGFWRSQAADQRRA